MKLTNATPLVSQQGRHPRKSYLQPTVSLADDCPPVVIAEYSALSALVAPSMIKVCFLPSILTLYLDFGPGMISSPFLNLG